MAENWLFIKTPDDYGRPEIIQFDDHKINYFTVEKNDESSSFETIKEDINREFIEYKFVNPNRVRFFEKGKIRTVLSNEESTTEDFIFENDYEKLKPTVTDLTADEIQQLKFEFNWNGEKRSLRFNEILDSQAVREMNERMNRKGNIILLEKLDETLFLSLYSNNDIDKLIPIKYVDKEKIILYGFPKEPYEIDCRIIK